MQNQIKDIFKHYQAKPIGETRRYAVLLPLIKVEGEWHVLYEVRSETISQPGEVSFPGGRVEENESLKEAVIRETMEELNLSESDITIYGEMDYMVNDSRTIHCFIGELTVDNWENITPNEEVAKLFTIPLQKLIEEDPTYYKLIMDVNPNQEFPFDRIRNGANYKFNHYRRDIPFYEITEENLWGMTALFTHRFTEIIEKNT